MAIPVISGVISGLTSLTKALGNAAPIQSFNKEFAQVQQGFATAGKNLAPVKTALNAIGDIGAAPFKAIAGALNAVQGPALKVVGALGQMRDSMTALGNSVSQFTVLANPAITQRFKFAADDLTASIGRALIPTLQFATKMTRGFADIMFVLSGPIARLTNSILKPMGEVFTSLINALGPVARAVGTVMDTVTALLRPLYSVASIFA